MLLNLLQGVQVDKDRNQWELAPQHQMRSGGLLHWPEKKSKANYPRDGKAHNFQMDSNFNCVECCIPTHVRCTCRMVPSAIKLLMSTEPDVF